MAASSVTANGERSSEPSRASAPVASTQRVSEPAHVAVKQSVVPLVQTNTLENEQGRKPIKSNNVSSAKDVQRSQIPGTPATINTSTKSEVASGPAIKATQVFSEQEKIILGWSASEYTLQLVGLSNGKAALDFVAAQPNKKDLLLFKSKRQGKDWFVVVTGHYPTSAKAREAAQGLSEAQKKASPWPREVKVIQQEIRQR